MAGSPRRITTTNASTAYGGLKTPDIVGNLLTTQSWGMAQLSMAYHQDYGTLHSANGGAVSGGVQYKLPMIAPGDTAYLLAGMSDGGISFVSQLGNSTGRTTEVAANQTVGTDFYDNGKKLKLTAAWSAQAGMHHEINALWETNVDVDHIQVNGSGARDYSYNAVGGDIRWKPVKNFYIAFDAEYGQLTYTSATKALLGANKASYDGWTGLIRVYRSF